MFRLVCAAAWSVVCWKELFQFFSSAMYGVWCMGNQIVEWHVLYLYLYLCLLKLNLCCICTTFLPGSVFIALEPGRNDIVAVIAGAVCKVSV